MNTAAINTSPLIFLSKLDMLESLTLFKKIYTTSTVLEEVENGLAKGFSEAIMVKRLVEQGVLIVKEDKNDPIQGLTNFGLHNGELSLLKISTEIKPDVIIVDDRIAIRAAKYLGFNVASTPFLLLKSLEAGQLGKDEFPEVLERLMGFGYFLSPGLYVKILKIAEQIGSI